jgi:hypothetical protein
MPRIPQEYLDCAVYLYPSEQTAKDGDTDGGTGFLLSFPSSKHSDVRYIYAVTNAHMIEGDKCVIRYKHRFDDEPVIMALNQGDWVSPEIKNRFCDDIAVAFLFNLPTYSKPIHAIPFEKLVTREMVNNHTVGAGDDVFMVGRFVGYDGKQQNTPTVRFGNIALDATEIISQEPSRYYEQESFMIEMRSISGFSGAAVFVYDAFIDIERTGVLVDSREPFLYLLGINWGHIRDDQHKVHSSMAGVVPAWLLSDLLLQSQELDVQRKKRDKEIQEQKNKSN